MTVRTIGVHQAPKVPCAWQRRMNRLETVVEPRVPEPAQLYSLIALTLVLHEPNPATGNCECCADTWPCEPARLAYRLREGF
ncbi:hypothetical protein [Amycolatopsis sp. H20-H5]|uniref:hypothetical protein n=1 Tax=Amycolatopsis sp. H20-H5 TaxID=3046309 RepID=UPI002DBA87B3|nr:hypothetical protein [Amycolatopsis sp. H20-H5]MEC3978160.1 hypothetical protein [Amycolatopsis sp. H20-H5]